VQKLTEKIPQFRIDYEAKQDLLEWAKEEERRLAELLRIIVKKALTARKKEKESEKKQ
jgi:hypothetical protein